MKWIDLKFRWWILFLFKTFLKSHTHAIKYEYTNTYQLNLFFLSFSESIK